MSHEKNWDWLYASDNALSKREHSIPSVINNQVSSMSSQWRRSWMNFSLQYMQIAIGCTQFTAWFAVEWCTNTEHWLIVWQTCLRHCCSTQTCAGLKNRYTCSSSRFSHFHHDPTCLTWRAIALRCTVNSLHSWYKLPFTLFSYHITCSFVTW